MDYTSLYGEVIHAIQDKYEYCGDNHAAIEYQEHVIGDIEYILSGRAGALRTIFNQDYPSNYPNWINNECFNESYTALNLNKFLNGINNYISDFQKNYSNTASYQGNIPSDYNFNWVEMFQKLGIPTF